MSIKVKAIKCNVSFDKKEGRPPFVEPSLPYATFEKAYVILICLRFTGQKAARSPDSG